MHCRNSLFAEIPVFACRRIHFSIRGETRKELKGKYHDTQSAEDIGFAWDHVNNENGLNYGVRKERFIITFKPRFPVKSCYSIISALYFWDRIS